MLVWSERRRVLKDAILDYQALLALAPHKTGATQQRERAVRQLEQEARIRRQCIVPPGSRGHLIGASPLLETLPAAAARMNLSKGEAVAVHLVQRRQDDLQTECTAALGGGGGGEAWQGVAPADSASVIDEE